MADAPKFAILNLAEVPTTRSPDFKVIYANNVNIGMSPWDIQMTFGKITSGNTIEHQITVVISPQWAKALAGVYQRVVADYESQFGKVALPEQLLAAQSIVPVAQPAKKKTKKKKTDAL
jgi:hypothetical protein